MKKTLKKFNSNNILTPLIILVIIVIIANSIMLFYSFNLLQKADQTREKAERALSAYTSIWDQIKSSDLGIRSFLINQDEKMLEPHIGAKKNYQGIFDELQGILTEQDVYLNELKSYRNAFDQKIMESDHIVSLAQNNQMDEAMEIYNQDSGADLFANHFWPLQQKLVAYEEDIINKANEQYKTSFFKIKTNQVVLLVASIPVLIMVISMLRKGDKKQKDIYKKLKESNNHYIFDKGNTENQEQKEDKIIEEIIDNLDQATVFIQQITSGNYEIEWEGLDDKNRESCYC